MAKDLFSKQSAGYALYRTTYPQALIRYLLSFVAKKENAWDGATGNGQAAVLLSADFAQVAATDLSQQQLDQAIERPNILYSASPAEKTPFPDNYFDLITVAQAYHWFDFDAFYHEATRVGKPGAVVAVWGYKLLQSADPVLNDMIQSFYTDVMGPYWDKERKYVDEEYRTVPFYFEALGNEQFNIFTSYDFDQFVGYFNSWSSVQHYIEARQQNPVEVFAKKISGIWKAGDQKSFHFPLFIRLGKIKK